MRSIGRKANACVKSSCLCINRLLPPPFQSFFFTYWLKRNENKHSGQVENFYLLVLESLNEVNTICISYFD